MAYDDKNPKVEVESLKRRFPKRGIDPTIPEGIRATLRGKEQDALTPDSKYAKGGKIRRFAAGGQSTSRLATDTTTPPTPKTPPTPVIYTPPTPKTPPTPVIYTPPTPKTPPTSEPKPIPMAAPARSAEYNNTDANRRQVMNRAKQPAKFAKGGSVSRGDGCAQRGKTKGRMV